MNKENNVLVLEVNGKKSVLEYQKALYEAAVLGISHVMFILVLDDSEKHENNINSMREPLYKTCDILGIEPTKSTVTVYGSLIGTSVGTINENGNIKSLSNLPKFSNFKRRKENSEKLKNMESFEKVYMKKLQAV